MASVWTSRLILFAAAAGLMIAWMHPALEFAPPRGSEIARPHVHVFFLGLVALSLIGLFCSFGMAAWRFRVTAAVVLAVSTALWV